MTATLTIHSSSPHSTDHLLDIKIDVSNRWRNISRLCYLFFVDWHTIGNMETLDIKSVAIIGAGAAGN